MSAGHGWNVISRTGCTESATPPYVKTPIKPSGNGPAVAAVLQRLWRLGMRYVRGPSYSISGLARHTTPARHVTVLQRIRIPIRVWTPTVH